MTVLHQIIDRLPDSIDDDYEVLFDFDDAFALTPATRIGPPEMRYASTWTHLTPGELMAANSFGARSLKIALNALNGNAEEQAENIQTLGRLLAEPKGQWFLWFDEGTVNPRFFKTWPSSMEIEDVLLTEDPLRGITITIPADPFGLGDLVEEEFVVTNDPTTGTHPMVIEISDVKGDVPTPIWMSMDYTDTDLTERRPIIAASATDPDIDGGLVLCDPGAIIGATTWTRNVVADVSAIGGSCIRYTRVGATEIHTTAVQVPGIEHGNYRILARARGVPGGANYCGIRAWAGIGENIENLPSVPPATGVVMDADWNWFDLDVFRIPGGAPLVPDRAETNLNFPMVSTIAVRLGIDNPLGTSIDIDTIMLVPAGLDRANLSTMLRASQIPSFTDSQVWIDGINDATYLVADDTVDSTTQVEPLAADGDVQYLVPGNLNRLFVVPDANMYATVVPDDKTWTVTVKVRHRPQYLYIRSATG